MDYNNAFETNRKTWNERTIVHFNSSFYDSISFAAGKSSLNTYELQALTNVSGKSLLHLQCHFGQDTLSWARLGAEVTGVDISDTAISKAQELSETLAIPATFVCCNVLDTSQYVKETFDIIFTSYGTIGWLPDLAPWAQMISDRLKPGGIFYMVEFHPIAWMYDYSTGVPILKYGYAQKETIYEEYSGTYAQPDAAIVSKEYGWNHSLSHVVQSLIYAGLTIDLLQEHDGSPYDIFPGMIKKPDGLYCLAHGLFPTIFELKALKKD